MDSPIIQAIKDGQIHIVKLGSKRDMFFDSHSNSWLVYDVNLCEIIFDTKDEARTVAVLLGEKP